MHEIHEQGLTGLPPADVEKGPTKHCVMTLTRLRKEAKHSVLLMIWRDQISYTKASLKCATYGGLVEASNHRRKRLITSCDKIWRIT